jgi:hypothetical protein
MAAMKLRLIGLAGLAILATHGTALAGGADVFDDLFGPYLDRSDKVTPGAGDAKDTNAAAHVIDPWPPRVGDKHIRYDGKRVGDAVHRYRQGPDAAAAPTDAASKVDASAPSNGPNNPSGGEASASTR